MNSLIWTVYATVFLAGQDPIMTHHKYTWFDSIQECHAFISSERNTIEESIKLSFTKDQKTGKVYTLDLLDLKCMPFKFNEDTDKLEIYLGEKYERDCNTLVAEGEDLLTINH
tara:strand:+ start:191 stop:529 length:339 start_codon:yes stop_codon:yes gene_type:complete